MSTEHVIPDLDHKGLRDFGLTTGGIVAVLFGLFFPWLLHRPWPLWPWILLALLGSFGLLAPMALRPVYRGWMHVGLILSRVTTPLILGIVFFAVISPIALWRRLWRNDDALQRSFDDNAASYRSSNVPTAAKNFERPF